MNKNDDSQSESSNISDKLNNDQNRIHQNVKNQFASFKSFNRTHRINDKYSRTVFDLSDFNDSNSKSNKQKGILKINTHKLKHLNRRKPNVSFKLPIKNSKIKYRSNQNDQSQQIDSLIRYIHLLQFLFFLQFSKILK